MRKLWTEIRSSLWFVPSVIVLGAVMLAIGVVELDTAWDEGLRSGRSRPFFDAGAEGARGMLEAIAGSMITVAGVAFSVTIVTLSLASSQYTPRILRNFMRDRANQSVLGVFVGVFAYCLVCLRTIRSAEQAADAFVPQIAVLLAVVLAMTAIGFLVFFIHHTAASIQASQIIDSITRETLATLGRLHPCDSPAPERPPSVGRWHPISAPASGYLQSIARDSLARWTAERSLVVRLDRVTGDFVADGAPLARSSRPLQDGELKSFQRCLAIGNFRTVEQDPTFGIRQIVDIAMKALSPGINDTSTAVTCLDYLSTLLTRAADNPLHSPFCCRDGASGILADDPDFSSMLALGLDEVRLSSKGNATIALAMLCLLRRVAMATRRPDRLDAVRAQANLNIDWYLRSAQSEYDRDRIAAEADELRLCLAGPGSDPSR